MRTIEIKVYKFNELTERVKDRVRDSFRSRGDLFGWDAEWQDSLRAFCDKFGVKIKEYNVGYRGTDITTDAENNHFRGIRFKDIDKDESLTGYCGDSAFLYPFSDEWKRSGSALVAFKHALYEGLKEWENDRDHAYSDEAIDEFIEINEYEFTEDGDYV